MKLTPGKLTGLKKVSTERGIIAAAAMDQRGSLQKSLAKEKGSEVSDAMMEEFKSLVTEVLTPHASAILLDPEWGLPASKRRARNAGLLLAYEKTGYDKTGPGRLPDLLDHWSARRLKEAGADCVKILLYYTPFDPKPINDQKHAWVERLGDECRANDIPFFLEFVTYEEGADEKGCDDGRATRLEPPDYEYRREQDEPQGGISCDSLAGSELGDEGGYEDKCQDRCCGNNKDNDAKLCHGALVVTQRRAHVNRVFRRQWWRVSPSSSRAGSRRPAP